MQTAHESMALNLQKPEKTNGHKVAVIGSGPAGLTCAGDLAKLGYEVTSISRHLHQARRSTWYTVSQSSVFQREKVVAAERSENVKALGVTDRDQT